MNTLSSYEQSQFFQVFLRYVQPYLLQDSPEVYGAGWPLDFEQIKAVVCMLNVS